MRTRRLVTLASVIATLAVSAAPAFAQTPSAPTSNNLILSPWLSYAAKFICGMENGQLNERMVVNGRYRTVINIHNPHYLVDMDFPIPVQFFKKVVLALPQGEIPLRPSCKKEEFLDVDQALAVNCRNILIQLQESGLPVPGPFEGFLVIEVPPQTIPESETPELDVVAIYTARHRTGTSPDVRDYDVQTMDVEKVEPRRVIGEPMSKRHMQS